MCCTLLCSHRVWNPNPSPNLNSSPTVEISHYRNVTVIRVKSIEYTVAGFVQLQTIADKLRAEKVGSSSSWRERKAGSNPRLWMPHNCKSGRKELSSREKDTKISGEYKNHISGFHGVFLWKLCYSKCNGGSRISQTGGGGWRAPIPAFGAKTYYLAIFCRKLHSSTDSTDFSPVHY